MNGMESEDKKNHLIRILLYCFLIGFSIFAPLLLIWLDLSMISFTRVNNQIYELFGFCSTLSILIIAAFEYRKKLKASLEEKILIAAFVLIAFHFLFLLTEYSFKSWDYRRYELAAQSIRAGENPYGEGYLYPPLLAQIMAKESGWIESTWENLGIDYESKDVWNLVFYFYQCFQFLMLILAFLLGFKFARSLGLKIIPALCIVLALFLFNGQIYRNLRYNQINLWILNSILLGILLARHLPWLGGMAVALGAHLKIYPLAMFLPWIVTRKWKAILGCMIGIIILLVLQTGFCSDFHLWSDFLQFNKSSFPSTTQFRDNSLYSLSYNLFRMTGLIALSSEENLKPFIRIISTLLSLLVLFWIGMRYFQREKILAGNNEKIEGIEWFKFCGHAIDAIALVLMLSPLVWAYHYVLAIPIVIWSAATKGIKNPWKVGLAAFLMLGFPVFDVFPFSYHRIVGLVILLVLTSPKKLSASITH